MGVLGAVEHISNEIAMNARAQASNPSPGAGHLVVVEGLRTCQHSHLTGKPGAVQGSPLRVAQGGPIGYGRRPRPAHTDAV